MGDSKKSNLTKGPQSTEWPYFRCIVVSAEGGVCGAFLSAMTFGVVQRQEDITFCLTVGSLVGAFIGLIMGQYVQRGRHRPGGLAPSLWLIISLLLSIIVTGTLLYLYVAFMSHMSFD